MHALSTRFLLLTLLSTPFLCACETSQAKELVEHEAEGHKIVVTSPVAREVITTQQYVSQIHSRRHIEVRALETGYLEEVHVKEGQAVRRGDVMFRMLPVLFQASLDSESAEADLARIKYNNTALLAGKSIVSDQELALAKAELARAHAKVKRARAELNFTSLKAPFDGIVDRQYEQQGSLIEEGDILSTLSDNDVMWVYFNVPEARYFEYRARLKDEKDGLDVELQLANGEIFPQPGQIGAIEADFNNQTGNIPFRADFPNPEGMLRHGQTGTILVHRKLPGAIVIPQRATYEILAKKYVFVVEPAEKKEAAHGETPKPRKPEKTEPASAENKSEPSSPRQHGVVRQREIVIQDEMDDIYVIKSGLKVDDKIIFEGVRQVRDGDEIDYEFTPPQEILSHLKSHAE